jgi:hypothetical protein
MLKEWILILINNIFDRINRIFRIYVFLVSSHRPIGPTARREETKKIPSAYGGKKDFNSPHTCKLSILSHTDD